MYRAYAKKMSSQLEAIPITVPGEYVSNSCGFSLDIGGSVAKLVYRSKREYRNGKPLEDLGTYANGQPKGRLYLVLVPRNKLEVIIDYIKEHCDMTPRDGEITIKTTGVGGNFFKQQLQKELKIKTTNVLETDCFVRAANFVREVFREEELYTPVSEEAVVRGEELGLRLREIDKSWGMTKASSSSAENTAPDREWPVMYVMCGSGFGVIEVEASGSHKMDEGLVNGGRTFLGITRMLTGLENYNDIMALAEKGDGQSVDIMACEVRGEGKGEFGDYGPLGQFPLFPFGKVPGQPREKLKKEDLIHSLVNLICTDLVRVVYLSSRQRKINKIFFMGNFVNNKMIRDNITASLTSQNSCRKPGEKPLEFHFIRNGGHFGALGAYLYDSLRARTQTI